MFGWLRRLLGGIGMARRKHKRGGKRRMVCPKTRSGRKVHAAKGRCYIKTPVKKVHRKRAKHRRRHKR